MLYVDITKQLSRFELRIKLESDDEILGVFGASGAGKSMLLKCIAGIEKPDSGVIRLNDRTLYDSKNRVNLTPQERRVGYLFQDYALFPHMTVRQNILTGLHRQPRRERIARAIALEEQFHVAGLSDRRPDLLSGGERQRAALARLFASSPELILLDEPFSSLDTTLKCELIPMMRDTITSYGKGCLMVSHDASELSALCDRVANVTDGRNAEPLTADQFTTNIQALYAQMPTHPLYDPAGGKSHPADAEKND